MERHMFNVDYMSNGYGPTHQKLIQDIMKYSKWTKWTHTRLIWAKIWIFTKSWELEAFNEESFAVDNTSFTYIPTY